MLGTTGPCVRRADAVCCLPSAGSPCDLREVVHRSRRIGLDPLGIETTGGEMVGVLALEHGESVTEMLHLVVDHRHQGQGIGAATGAPDAHAEST